MSSPFLCAEPIDLEQKQQQPHPQPEKEKKQKQHPDVLESITVFNKVLEDPTSPTKQWDFISRYISYLNKNQSEILDVFNTLSDVKETNLFTLINKNGKSYDLYTFFVTIIEICTKIAQNKNSTDQVRYILQCIMLANDTNSPVFSYTELLHTYQQGDSPIYKELNNKFSEVYLTLDPSTTKKEIVKQEIKSKPLETVTPPSSGKKVGLALTLFLTILLIIGSIYYFVFMKSGNLEIPDIMADFN